MRSEYCLITGASNGLGKAISFELAKGGWNLFLIDLPQSGLGKLTDYLKHVYKISVLMVEADLSGSEGCRAVVDHVSRYQLRIKYLVNNAGVLSRGLFEDQEVGYFMNQIKVNVLAPTYLSRELLSNLKANL